MVVAGHLVEEVAEVAARLVAANLYIGACLRLHRFGPQVTLTSASASVNAGRSWSAVRMYLRTSSRMLARSTALKSQ